MGGGQSKAPSIQPSHRMNNRRTQGRDSVSQVPFLDVRTEVWSTLGSHMENPARLLHNAPAQHHHMPRRSCNRSVLGSVCAQGPPPKPGHDNLTPRHRTRPPYLPPLAWMSICKQQGGSCAHQASWAQAQGTSQTPHTSIAPTQMHPKHGRDMTVGQQAAAGGSHFQPPPLIHLDHSSGQ